MIVMINGSFGVGKSTVANILSSAFRGSTVFNPEWAGSVLMRLPKWIGLRGAGTDDFQDINLWRKSAVAGIKLFSSFASGPVIVPMTFSNRLYFDEVVAGLRRHDAEVRVFCLKASMPTVKKRLATRRVDESEAEWVARRNLECAEAHNDSHFGEAVDTEDRSAAQVAQEIIKRLAPGIRGHRTEV